MNEVKASAAKKLSAAEEIEAIAKALRADSEGEAKKSARQAVKAITGTWEHIPVRIRSAIRTDVGRFVAASKGKADLIEAGYSEITAERALRDLGHRG